MARIRAIDLHDSHYSALTRDVAKGGAIDGALRDRLATGLAQGVRMVCDEGAWRGGVEGDGMYTGRCGVALALKRVVDNGVSLGLPGDVTALADEAFRGMLQRVSEKNVRWRHTFLGGKPGVNTFKALLYPEHADAYCDRVVGVDTAGESAKECELLYGRAGYLYALLCLYTAPTVSQERKRAVRARMVDVIREVHTEGKGRTPQLELMYSWYNEPYLGAVHGIAGICYVLLQCPRDVLDEAGPHVFDDVRTTVMQLPKLALPDGNYPTVLGERGARLNQFCHGSPGFIMLYCKAYEIFGDEQLKASAVKSAATLSESVMPKGCGLCHGPPGAIYPLLAVHRITHDPRWLAAAAHLTAVALDNAPQMATWSDRPLSLYEGVAGLICVAADVLTRPERALMPGFDVMCC